MAEELTTQSATSEPAPAAPEMDISATVEKIASDLHLAEAPTEATEKPAAEAGGPPVATPEAPEAETPLAAAAPPTPAPEDQPPDTWTKGSKEKWGTISPELRQEIRKRESDISRYVGETKQAVQVAQAFEKVVAPFAEVLQRNNIDPWQHTANLLQAHAQLTWGDPQTKTQAFIGLAQQAGIDLRALATGQGVAALNNQYLQRMNQLEDYVRKLEAGVTGVTSAVQTARAAELESGVLAFAQDEAAHPFFWEVVGEIQHFIQTKAATTLEQAYELAVMANPVTRGKAIEAEASKRAANLAQLEAARAAKARKAAAANVRTVGTGRASAKAGTIDDTLKEALANIHARQ